MSFGSSSLRPTFPFQSKIMGAGGQKKKARGPSVAFFHFGEKEGTRGILKLHLDDNQSMNLNSARIATPMWLSVAARDPLKLVTNFHWTLDDGIHT